MFRFFKRKKKADAQPEPSSEGLSEPVSREAAGVDDAAETAAKAAPIESKAATATDSTIDDKAARKAAKEREKPDRDKAKTKRDAKAPARATPQSAPTEEEEKKNFFQRVVKSLAKTRDAVFGTLANVLTGRGKIDDELLEEIEDALYGADMGPEVTRLIVDKLRKAWKARQIEDAEQIVPFLKQDIKEELTRRGNDLITAESGPTVVLIVGVNGTGKTTSIGKLAARFKFEGLKVIVGAGDTFRAAAENQLRIWAEDRVGVDFIQAPEGVTDPGAVAHAAAEKARDGKYDVLLFDTAGRLHTQKNLMEQLSKIKRVLSKQIPGAPHEVLMVLDATTGQNAITQAQLFKEAAGVTGLFLAKLDSSAKGGVVLAINQKVDIPVKFIGTGEQMHDIAPFNPDEFVDALFTSLAAE